MRSPFVFAVLVAVGVTCFVGCNPLQPLPSPDLKLLMSEDGRYPSRPQVSPDGRWVYYLDNASSWPIDPFTAMGGELRVLDTSDGSTRLLLAGDFRHLAMTRDGRKLAVLVRQAPNPESLLFIVMDTSATVAETLRVLREHEAVWSPTCMKFSSSGSELLLSDGRSSRSGGGMDFYSLDIVQDTSLTWLFRVPWTQCHFDVIPGDTIVYDSLVQEFPAVYPLDTRWVVFARPEQNEQSYHWGLLDRTTGEVSRWGGDKKPFNRFWAGMPSWTPDGRSMVFAAASPTRFWHQQPYERFELWMLENAPNHMP